MTGRRLAGALLCLVALAGCGAQRPRPGADAALRTLEREARPIGTGPRFHPPAPRRVRGRCRARLGPRYPVHLELFAADRVVLLPAGIGARPPRRVVEGRIAGARCFGDLVTLDPTGLVLVRPTERATLGDLFGSWGQPLSARRLGPFRDAQGRVRVYVDGRRLAVSDPAAVRLRRHAEIVLEAGPYVPPYPAYYFPPGT